MLFFLYFFRKWAETFSKLQFFTFGQKQCLYLTHSALQCSEKMTFEKSKNATWNCHTSRSRTNIESKLIFSEGSLNFLESSISFISTLATWVHNTGFCLLQHLAARPEACKAKRVNNVPKKKLYLLFSCIYLKNELKLPINFNFSALVKSNVLLNPFSPVTLWKSDIWKKNKKHNFK